MNDKQIALSEMNPTTANFLLEINYRDAQMNELLDKLTRVNNQLSDFTLQNHVDWDRLMSERARITARYCVVSAEIKEFRRKLSSHQIRKSK